MKPQCKTSLVIFLDLLGFSKACLNPDNLTNLYELLEKFTQYNGDYARTPLSKTQEGSTRYQISSGFLSMSDSIVISYPLDDLLSHNGILMSCSRQLAYIALLSIRSRFLIRGGMAQGALIHKDNKVLGCGYIEAYNLESKKEYSKNIDGLPMIVISNKLIELYSWDQVPTVTNTTTGVTTQYPELSACILESNTEGKLYHLRYIRDMLTVNIPSGNNFFTDVTKRYNEIANIVAEEVQKPHDRNIKRKWEWFGIEIDKEYSYLRELFNIDNIKNQQIQH